MLFIDFVNKIIAVNTVKFYTSLVVASNKFNILPIIYYLLQLAMSSPVKRKKRGFTTLALGQKNKRRKYDWLRANPSTYSQTEPSISHSSVQTSPSLKDTSTQYKVLHFGTHNEKKLQDFHSFEYLHPFVNRLRLNKQLDTFLHFMKLVVTGKFSLDNIAWLAFLDRVKWQNCLTTTAITYNSDMKEFWNLVRNMFGSSVLNVLRGPGHFGQVVTEQASKSIYDPEYGTCNFAIPSIRTLNQISTNFPKTIPPGFIEQTLDIFQEQSLNQGAQYILSFDAKQIAPGCKGDRCGDVDLFGHEGPPSLDTALEILGHKIVEIEELPNGITADTIDFHRTRLFNLLLLISIQIRKLRKREMAQSMLKQ